MFKITITSNIAAQIERLEKRVNNVTNNLLPAIAASPELSLFLGRAYQRGIDNNQSLLKPLTKKDEVYKEKRYRIKKILVREGKLYKRAIEPGFFSVQADSNRLEVSIADLIALYQAKEGRNPLRLDAQFSADFNSLANKKMSELLKG